MCLAASVQVTPLGARPEILKNDISCERILEQMREHVQGWLDSTLAAPRQNVVNFSSSVILYVQPPPPLGSKPEIPYSVYSFSGASCAGFTLTSAGCGRDPPFGWITDEAVFRQDGILATGVNGSGSTGCSHISTQTACTD